MEDKNINKQSEILLNAWHNRLILERKHFKDQSLF
jgi:hypothetical protein